jgi:hypothetical protein
MILTPRVRPLKPTVGVVKSLALIGAGPVVLVLKSLRGFPRGPVALLRTKKFSDFLKQKNPLGMVESASPLGGCTISRAKGYASAIFASTRCTRAGSR